METVDRQIALKEEAVYLHHSLFGRSPSSEMLEAYGNAHDAIPELRQLPQSQYETVATVVAARLDAVGIEPWLRSAGRRHALSAKLLLLCFLVEAGGRAPEFDRSRTVGYWG